MTKPPRTIQIGPFLYRVDCSGDGIAKERYESGESSRVGVIRFHQLVIVLDPTLPVGLLRESLLHEVLHGVQNVVCKYDEAPPTDWERVISQFSPLLLDTLRRNPDLTAFLMGPDIDHAGDT